MAKRKRYVIDEDGYYDPQLGELAAHARPLVKKALPSFFFQFDWQGVLWKIVIAEIIYFIAKLVYGAWVTAELLKKHPEMVIPQYMNILPWQAFASPLWLIFSALYPAATGEDLDKKRQDALAEIGVPAILDDIFGKYTYTIMMAIPIIILLLEWSNYRKKQKEAHYE